MGRYNYTLLVNGLSLVVTDMDVCLLARFVVFCYIVYACLHVTDTSVDIRSTQLSWKDAYITCGHGNKHLIGEHDLDLITSDLLVDLKYGNYYWVNGLAKFSPFVYYIQCVSWTPTIGQYHQKYIRNNVYHCSEGCRDDGYMYFGLRHDDCYRLSTSVFESDEQVDPSFCSERCKSTFTESCGAPNYVAIYGLANVDDVKSWSMIGPHGQCILLKKTNQSVIATDKRCSLYCHNCGYLCGVDTETPIEYKYLKKISCIGNTCVIDDTRTWLQANDVCQQEPMRGYLSNIITRNSAINKILSIIMSGHNYWTGLFRTFIFDTNKTVPTSNDDACVSVYKHSNRLQFESADCEYKRRYICINGTTYPTTANSKHTTAPTQGASTAEELYVSSATNQAPKADISADVDNSSTTVTIGVVASVCGLALVCLIAVVIICRRSPSCRRISLRFFTRARTTKYPAERSAAAKPFIEGKCLTDDNTAQGPIGASGGPPPDTPGYDECTVKRASEVEYVYIDKEVDKAVYVYTDGGKPAMDGKGNGGANGTNAEYEIPDQPPPADSQYITPIQGPHLHAGEYIEFHSSEDNTPNVYSGLASTAGGNEHQYSALVL